MVPTAAGRRHPARILPSRFCRRRRLSRVSWPRIPTSRALRILDLVVEAFLAPVSGATFGVQFAMKPTLDDLRLAALHLPYDVELAGARLSLLHCDLCHLVS